jgi:HEAT repeat protein
VVVIEAADDPSEIVRHSALYGLADSLDPAAMAELRNHLKDDSEIVRFYAACFLTEFQDASGLSEMRQALARLRKAGEAEAEARRIFDYWLQVEMLLASCERITGKSFGEIPLNPSLFGIVGGGVKE